MKLDIYQNNVSQIDFDSRDSDNLKYFSTDCQEVSTLPDCGNSLGKQRDVELHCIGTGSVMMTLTQKEV